MITIALYTEIRTKYHLLSHTQKGIADFILNNPDTVSLMSITDLAHKCNTSETTVIRFIKKLNYDSYQIFRIHLAQELSASPEETINDEITRQDPPGAIKKKIIQYNMTALKDLEYSLNDEDLKKAADYLLACDRLLVYGVGASGAVANDAIHKFSKLGLNTVGYPDSHLVNIFCSHLMEKDLLIAISHTGESKEVLNLLSIAKKRKMKVIAMTSFANSSLAKEADVLLLSSTNRKKYHSEAMASRLLQLTIIDILYIMIFLRDEVRFFDALTRSRIGVSLNKT